jgi:hypothetical protein
MIPRTFRGSATWQSSLIRTYKYKYYIERRVVEYFYKHNGLRRRNSHDI